MLFRSIPYGISFSSTSSKGHGVIDLLKNGTIYKVSPDGVTQVGELPDASIYYGVK